MIYDGSGTLKIKSRNIMYHILQLSIERIEK